VIRNGESHVVGGWRLDGSTVEGFPQVMAQSAFGATAQIHVADVDGNGDLELTTTAYDRDAQVGWVYVFPIPGSMADPAGLIAGWPKFLRDSANTGVFPPEDVTGVVDLPQQEHTLAISAYPNPFNPHTSVRFDTVVRQAIELSVFDVMGRRVATLAHEMFEPGRHEVRWDGRGESGGEMPSGTYLVRACGNDQIASGTLTLVR